MEEFAYSILHFLHNVHDSPMRKLESFKWSSAPPAFRQTQPALDHI